MVLGLLRVMLLAGLAALMVACSSSPQVERYLLAAPQLSALQDSQHIDQRLVIGNVEVAPFLAGSGVVQARGNMTLHQASYHRWAEPLPSQLQRQLRLGLQQQLPAATWLSIQGSAHLRSLDYRLDISIDSFHLLANGEAEVSGQWQLRSAEQGFVDAGQFNQRQTLSSDGYRALVDALQLAWTGSMQEIAEALADTLADLAPAGDES